MGKKRTTVEVFEVECDLCRKNKDAASKVSLLEAAGWLELNTGGQTQYLCPNCMFRVRRAAATKGKGLNSDEED